MSIEGVNRWAALHGLLCQLFEGQDLRRFVHALEHGEKIVTELPAQGASLSELADASIGQLRRRGLLALMFAGLRDEFPRRVAEIDAVAGLWREEPSAPPTTGGEGSERSADTADEERFDVFFSYHEVNRAAVARVAELLAGRGVRVWLDAWELKPGQPRVEQTEHIIGRARSAAVFVGPAGVVPWQQMEVDALLRQFVARRCPVIPVLLVGVAAAPELPLFLGGFTWVDLRDPTQDPIGRLVWGITGKRPERRPRSL